MPGAFHPGAADGEPITRRVIGFMRHLRLNGFILGPAETESALATLGTTHLENRDAVRLNLKTLLTSRREEWAHFDDLFEAYWMRRGRERAGAPVPGNSGRTHRSGMWTGHLPEAGISPSHTSEAEQAGRTEPGRLAASRLASLARTDLRSIHDPREIAEAERAALRLAKSLVYRLSRRFRRDNNGRRIDLRRTIRLSIPHGGEPIELGLKARPDRPVRIVLMVDVSGSMKPYSRFFLQFVKGMVVQWEDSDAYVFHTRLARVTDALRERDPLAAMTRLSLMAEGFGGGTKFGECLKVFNDRYAKRALNSRSVLFIVSDGYDTSPPEVLARELARLKRRVRRLVWLNPLLGWRDYEPITRAMTAALPFIDHFAAAHTLEALAAIEGDLGRL
jgi:uncharacterized protein with von Willebrand factor type A (vWA) domain